MYTDEPSVSLKLKKGGKVHVKGMKEEHGHKGMHQATGSMMHGAHHAFEAEHGKSPKKPSMHERMKAMNPNFKKGGKVAHKVMGGAMPMGAQAPMGGAPMGGAPMAPMSAPALGQMSPQQRAQRAMMVRKALTGMKKGGMCEKKDIEKLEKELHHHEKLDMKHAHPMKKASGGEIDKAETRTTIEKGAKKFEKTKVNDGQHHDKHHGTGDIKEGKPAGYKHGGHTKKHHKATGGDIPADTHESKNNGKTKFGGTIEDNEGDYLETEMHSAKADRNHGTGGIPMSNAGGYRHGGKAHKMHHKASGGMIDKEETRNTIEGGNWENRPANSAKAGKSHTKTGEVKEANAGGYKHGGHASKKHFATGGDVDMGQADRTLRQSSRGETRMPDLRALNKAAKQMGYEHYMDVPDSRSAEFHKLKKEHGYAKGGNVVDSGKPVKMPHHFISKPVANSLQSGTFKKGGKVKKFSDGGMEFAPGQDPKDVSPQDVKDAIQRSKDSEHYREASRITPRSAGAGRGFVNPPMAKKHGGRAKQC